MPRDARMSSGIATLLGALGGLPKEARPARLDSLAEPGPTRNETVGYPTGIG
jgi:hypothetical protein